MKEQRMDMNITGAHRLHNPPYYLWHTEQGVRYPFLFIAVKETYLERVYLLWREETRKVYPWFSF